MTSGAPAVRLRPPTPLELLMLPERMEKSAPVVVLSVTVTLRTAPLRSVLLRKSVWKSEVVEPRRRAWPVGTNPERAPAPPQMRGTGEPPLRLTVSLAVEAAKPPAPLQ